MISALRAGLVALLMMIACGDGGAATGPGASSETATGGPTSPDPNSSGSTTAPGSTGSTTSPTTGAAADTTGVVDERLRINHLQAMGTHNSCSARPRPVPRWSIA